MALYLSRGGELGAVPRRVSAWVTAWGNWPASRRAFTCEARSGGAGIWAEAGRISRCQPYQAPVNKDRTMQGRFPYVRWPGAGRS